MKAWLALLVIACSSHGTGPGGSVGSGAGSAPPVSNNAKTCDEVRLRVERLYHDEALVKEPKRVDEAIADNTQMAMADCAKDPGKAVPCMAKAASVAELEKQCLVPLDDEGTEGEALAR